MLQKIGWIKIDENADPSTVTQEDIVENPYNIQFTEMNSMTIPATMADFDYVAITGSVVYNAGIDASTACLLYTSDAADEEDSVDLGGRRIIKKKKTNKKQKKKEIKKKKK